MKQVGQRMKDGQMRTMEVPVPEVGPYQALVLTEASLISAGTERAKVTVARESLVGKARSRPDQVKKVLEKVQRDGLRSTFEAVRIQLEEMGPLGYCAAGRVLRTGPRIAGVQPGDLVACGSAAAAHAEVLAVPQNLMVRVPAGVPAEQACFATLGAIAMQGFRQADLRLRERVAIVGMGLVGQLTARLAKAAGCEVLGIDLDPWRLELARAAGCVDHTLLRGSIGKGDLDQWDAVIVTAAAPSSDPASLATDLARDRGRIVIVGDVKLELDRARFYEKELELKLARSYGPGRHDIEYEQRGLDYPLPYVRWTEQRNMASFLDLVADGSVRLDDLVTHTFPIEEATAAFDLLADRGQRSLAIVLSYPNGPALEAAIAAAPAAAPARAFAPGSALAFVGAGSFAQRYLIPLAKEAGLALDRVATSTGLSAASVAERFAFARGAATAAEILADPAVNAVVVATRHDRHGSLALESLAAGKATFVEKPLCTSEDELEQLAAAATAPGAPPLMVGFNRRHAPLTVALKAHLDGARGPTNAVIRVNAGMLPADHWLNDPVEGGGRLLGEGCHFVDLLCHLAGPDATPVAVSATGSPGEGEPLQAAQDVAVTIRFSDGSLGVLLYGTAGAGAAGKELVEAHRGDRSGRLDDFGTLQLWGGGKPRSESSRGRDKGHAAEVARFARLARGEDQPSAAETETYLTSMRVTFAAIHALATGAEVRLDG